MKHIRWRLGAFLAATALLGLAFGTAKTRGLEGGPADVARYEAKQRRLLTAIADGDVGLESFTESVKPACCRPRGAEAVVLLGVLCGKIKVDEGGLWNHDSL